MGLLIIVVAVVIIVFAIKGKQGQAVNTQPLSDDEDDNSPPFKLGPLSERDVGGFTGPGDGMPDFEENRF